MRSALWRPAAARTSPISTWVFALIMHMNLESPFLGACLLCAVSPKIVSSWFPSPLLWMSFPHYLIILLTHVKKSARKAIKDPIWKLFWDNFMHNDAAEESALWKEEVINIIIIFECTTQWCYSIWVLAHLAFRTTNQLMESRNSVMPIWIS